MLTNDKRQSGGKPRNIQLRTYIMRKIDPILSLPPSLFSFGHAYFVVTSMMERQSFVSYIYNVRLMANRMYLTFLIAILSTSAVGSHLLFTNKLKRASSPQIESKFQKEKDTPFSGF